MQSFQIFLYTNLFSLHFVQFTSHQNISETKSTSLNDVCAGVGEETVVNMEVTFM
jgi:hypothetical protein